MNINTKDGGLHVDAAPTRDELRAILDADPVWAAYAIADLQPDYAPYCRWHVAESAQGAGLVLFFTRLSMPVVFAMGDPGAVGAVLDAVPRPKSVYMTLRDEHYEVASRDYDFSADLRPMWRMRLTDPGAARTDGASCRTGCSCGRWPPNDSERIRRLHAYGGPYAPDAFDVYQAESGIFFGVEAGSGELLAVGGTHIVDWSAGIGAIGNMYTHPAHRGEGLGTAVLRAIVGKLIAGGVANIVLNVDQRNIAAKRLYEQLGFEAYCPYLEGVGYRRRTNQDIGSRK